MITAQQHPGEWLWFVSQVTPFRSVLEIGSYDGKSLVALTQAIEPQGLIRSVDLGDHGTAEKLQNIVDCVNWLGFDCQCHIGNSHTDEAEKWAAQWQPYDVVFIDGDHSYEGVKEDWRRFGLLGKIVAFHDIAGGAAPGVKQFWEELKSGLDGKAEITELDQSGMGIGLVKGAKSGN